MLGHPRLNAVIVAPGEGGEPAGSVRKDEIYDLISSCGSLHGADGERIEVTAGDVLFVSAGVQVRFEDVSHRFRTWRLRLPLPAPTA